eukprot:CAMPEP_0177420306 /NCGR_PEP_ID=MMETSP0368-20130122/70183_1 /TAXON_ID=447022 ORGANISM="Scrippsiella hangoei-like, Strain SHHI-4" /NCGR_SAMPLE_ID=MMETSP0368 /ASSEMBLY_ACC=CAM_ASM_000363 /LENGTH=127 /DNA_ID=CAMNT_0018890085 /DNA_START=527 /DNA_END=906 /DNA_ORIENTATION=-
MAFILASKTVNTSPGLRDHCRPLSRSDPELLQHLEDNRVAARRSSIPRSETAMCLHICICTGTCQKVDDLCVAEPSSHKERRVAETIRGVVHLCAVVQERLNGNNVALCDCVFQSDALPSRFELSQP